ncbi:MULTISPECIES: 4Fe-4S dicluster domain-containing protein [Gordonibacter]|uniref:4Fe-4S dicluster domain-containing protein n=1 Tax=Gordonibacter faecis TaxID=3047475 RepID=A0ABT7DQD7_9ACTN|nr:4Fe-4S dicluster domain-containing protein [Gordonibacter sp. KGMB12511]MDJ1650375.1 4Fe-4S dicluster domain-containing protein [Gordonibacter sp. KGMB12511]HIW76780.1 4Fe-4S dicluster domain-containing protein [Candidatus Gordonibacter avicola]
MAFGFFFDNARCTGCKTCEMACKDYHDLGVEATFRRVIDYEGGTWRPAHGAGGVEEVEGVFAYHVSLACNHCGNPACTKVCPTGAMHKDEAGLVWPDERKCIGCGYCTMACPYHAPFIDQRLKRSSKCDGCRERQAEGKLPICVEACPTRALDCGEPLELAQRHPDAVRSILPLPAEDATWPNLLIAPSPAALLAAETGQGSIANWEEI